MDEEEDDRLGGYRLHTAQVHLQAEQEDPGEVRHPENGDDVDEEVDVAEEGQTNPVQLQSNEVVAQLQNPTISKKGRLRQPPMPPDLVEGEGAAGGFFDELLMELCNWTPRVITPASIREQSPDGFAEDRSCFVQAGSTLIDGLAEDEIDFSRDDQWLPLEEIQPGRASRNILEKPRRRC